MEDPVKTIQVENLTIKIWHDEDYNPRELEDHLGKMVCFHNRYDLGDGGRAYVCDPDDFNGWDEMERFLISKRNACVILPLYLYDHSGLTISTSPFSCPWDSGQIGFIFAEKDKIKSWLSVSRVTAKVKQQVKEMLKDEVKSYDMFLTGEYYGFEIKDSDGEYVDGCWGFEGYEFCKTEAMSTAKAIIETEKTVEIRR